MSETLDAGIRRELRLMRAYCGALTLAVAAACATAFQRAADAKTRFTEIDVERINVVEPDGKLRMVISNRPRSIGPIYKGKPFGYAGGTRPGIIFFNDEGTENGGLTFTGSRDSASGRYRATSHFSFDQFNQDQVLYFQYQDNNGQRRTGLTIADRADVDIYDFVQMRDSINRIADTTVRNASLRQLSAPRNGVPLVAQRLYVGRDLAKSAIVNLADPQGRTKLRMLVDSLGNPRIEFLNDSGRIVMKIPAG
jgi:hypothetical protein